MESFLTIASDLDISLHSSQRDPDLLEPSSHPIQRDQTNAGRGEDVNSSFHLDPDLLDPSSHSNQRNPTNATRREDVSSSFHLDPDLLDPSSLSSQRDQTNASRRDDVNSTLHLDPKFDIDISLHSSQRELRGKQGNNSFHGLDPERLDVLLHGFRDCSFWMKSLGLAFSDLLRGALNQTDDGDIVSKYLRLVNEIQLSEQRVRNDLNKERMKSKHLGKRCKLLQSKLKKSFTRCCQCDNELTQPKSIVYPEQKPSTEIDIDNI